jgi:hypothetical protein
VLSRLQLTQVCVSNAPVCVTSWMMPCVQTMADTASLFPSSSANVPPQCVGLGWLANISAAQAESRSLLESLTALAVRESLQSHGSNSAASGDATAAASSTDIAASVLASLQLDWPEDIDVSKWSAVIVDEHGERTLFMRTPLAVGESRVHCHVPCIACRACR